MKRLFSVLASALVLLVSGCENANPVRDALLERAGNLATVSDITYDDSYSSSTTLSVYWNPDAAISAGASSFKIVICEELFEFSDEEADVSNTLSFEVKVKDIPNDAVRMKITAGTPYYVKIAAVYPGPSTSDWVYLLDENGDPVQVIAGQGLVQ